MLKSSFILIEILISILILSFIFISFANSNFLFSRTNSNFINLLELENSIEKNDLRNFYKSSSSYEVLINDEKTTITLFKYSYKDENIKLVYYEK
ncbi:hypothetical protein [Aliarcobacter thereius]|uniref:Type II secretion system protein n=1 Tax=Aliarcobacter thereius TaxID=544718 RepID=A0A5R9H596_9BACT|nr:hypothetical protein [Aliarcobacter thereius]TLS71558.1 hypothetical protein FE246_08070 [Aliarcobacter thereius]TLS91676.1 hypothetical protein FE244_08490 [Aliarcobacter thereius]HJE03741.1 hypothetical protein [Aliarcobacter thereius]